MTARPVAKFEDGRLWLDTPYGYSPTERYHVAMMAQTQSSLRCPEAREIVRQCNEALKQFAANSGQMEESA